MKKNFLSRMKGRKGSPSAEPEEEAYEIPPPTAIEPGVPYLTEDTEEQGYGSHMEVELLASDESAGADAANGEDVQESDPAPGLELTPAPFPDEPRDTPEPPREAAPIEEYGFDLEILTDPETDGSPGESESPQPELSQEDAVSSSTPVAAEPLREDEEVVSFVDESAAHESPLEPEISQESEPEAVAASSPAHGESRAAPEMYDSQVAPEPLEEEAVASPVAESAVEAAPHEQEIPQKSEPEPADEVVQDVEETLAAPVSDELPDESDPPQPEPPQEDEVSSSHESLAEPPREQTNESSEISLAENGFLPLVRDARGNWRPGKGFSRSELREAGLSLAEAARLGVRVDKRRRNAHPMNVAALEEAKSGF